MYENQKYNNSGSRGKINARCTTDNLDRDQTNFTFHYINSTLNKYLHHNNHRLTNLAKYQSNDTNSKLF